MIPTISRHRLMSSSFTEFCSGPVGRPVMEDLRAMQLSRRKLLLRSLAEIAGDASGVPELSSSFGNAWDILAAAERCDPSVVEELLLHPSVGVWLAGALRAAAADRLCLADIGYLSSVAAAAAVRCEIPCTVDVPVVDDTITLPTVGQARLNGDTGVTSTVVRVSEAGTVIHVGRTRRLPIGGSPPDAVLAIEPADSIECERDGVRLRVELDDRGPYREFSEPIPPRPLDSGERQAWESQTGEAWDLLVADYRGFAEELSQGISTIVPLGLGSPILGASSSVAYGAVAVSRRSSAPELAEALIHEMQHSKLNALFDFTELSFPGTEDLGYAPWRDDPRPIGGLLHGVFAFTTAVEFWRGQRGPAGNGRGLADFHYAYRRWQVRHTLDSLAGAEGLTALGREFVDAVSGRLDLVEHDDVPGDVLDGIRKMTREHRAYWRAQHLRPDPRRVIRLAAAWTVGDLASDVSSVRPEVVPCHRHIPASKRLGMLKTLIIDGIDPAEGRGESDADSAYVNGDTMAARNAYEAEIRSSPDDDRAWLAFGLAGATSEENALVLVPEMVLAVRDRLLAGGERIDEPAKLVAWLDTALDC
ncbi:HEXXH motif domain-containing protein [Amycolatopsis sp. NPDC003865]